MPPDPTLCTSRWLILSIWASSLKFRYSPHNRDWRPSGISVFSLPIAPWYSRWGEKTQISKGIFFSPRYGCMDLTDKDSTFTHLGWGPKVFVCRIPCLWWSSAGGGDHWNRWFSRTCLHTAFWVTIPEFLSLFWRTDHFQEDISLLNVPQPYQSLENHCSGWGLFWNSFQFSSVQFNRSVMSASLQPHESRHTRPPCPSPTPGIYSNLCPSSWWCHLAISSSVIPFSSCPQSLPASGSFTMCQLFASGGQSIGVSASASVLSVSTQDWSPLGWTGWISLQSKGLSRVLSNTTVQKHQFFDTQLSSQSNFHIHTWPLEKR